MPFKLASLFVEIGTKTDGFEHGLSRVKSALGSALSSMGGMIKGAAGAIFSPLAAAASAATTGLAAALAALGIGAAAGMGYAVKAASDLNETVSAVEVVFGDAANTVKDAAQQMADSLGVPKQEFLEAAIGVGSMAKAAKMTKQEAADMGVSMVKLAADVSSLRNIPLADALEKIRSGLAGEAEPLRSLGVLLSEDAVKAEALRKGLAKQGQELTEGQKVIARASLITKGFADANGDLVRTQDSVSNRFREIQGRLQNLAADLGQVLLPAVRKLSGGLAEGVAAVKKFVDENKEAFDEWSSWLEEKAGVVVGIFKHWPEALEVAKAAIGGLRTNVQDVFDFITNNTGPVMDRIAIGIRDGFKLGMEAAVEVVKNHMDSIKHLMLGGFLGVGQFLLPDAPKPTINLDKPRPLVPFRQTPNTAMQDAMGAFNGAMQADKDAKAQKEAAESRAKAAAEEAKKPLSERRGFDPAEGLGRRLSDAIVDNFKKQDANKGKGGRFKFMKPVDNNAMKEALQEPPADAADADAAGKKKKGKGHTYGITDSDSYAKELQDGALKQKEVEEQILAENKTQSKTLEVIAANTAKAGPKSLSVFA